MTLFYRNIVKQQTSSPRVGHVLMMSKSYCNADLQTGLQAKPCPVRSDGISDELCSGPVQSCCVAGTSSLSTAGISSRPPPVLHCHSSSLESVSPRIWIWSRLLCPVWIDDDKHYKQLIEAFLCFCFWAAETKVTYEKQTNLALDGPGFLAPSSSQAPS